MTLPSGSGARPSLRAIPVVEQLESRVVPYAVTGNAWAHPELVTLSFVPDDTVVATSGGSSVGSNLFATFDARWSTSVWQTEILEAAQEWAQYADINFAVVSDDGVESGSGDYQQGDPDHGDVRIGGYSMFPAYLAEAYLPPSANNYDIAGDVNFNTSKLFNLGLTYDLRTVAVHELGHSLGLGHSTNFFAAMYPTYLWAKPTLHSDDIAGIQAIYGARSQDSYDASASNGSFATASDITSEIDTNDLTALVTDLDVTGTSDADYYTFTTPTGSESSFNVTVQSEGLSLLRGSLKVYDANENLVGSSTGTGITGGTLTVTVTGVSEGEDYYVVVDGADASLFGFGAYGMTLNFGTGDDPEVPLPDTQEENGNPIQGGTGDHLYQPGSGHDHEDGEESQSALTPAQLAASANLTQQTTTIVSTFVSPRVASVLSASGQPRSISAVAPQTASVVSASDDLDQGNVGIGADSFVNLSGEITTPAAISSALDFTEDFENETAKVDDVSFWEWAAHGLGTGMMEASPADVEGSETSSAAGSEIEPIPAAAMMQEEDQQAEESPSRAGASLLVAALTLGALAEHRVSSEKKRAISPNQ